MELSNSFPLRTARKFVRGAFILSSCVALSGVSVFANNNNNPKGGTNARPVARLVSTSRHETPKPRERYVAATTPRLANAPTAAARPIGAASLSVAANGDEMEVLRLINAERRARGAQPLVLSGELTRVARSHSESMARQDFFNHIGRDGRDARARVAANGINGWQALGENIAYNQGLDDPAAFAVERWMLSSKHRDNILSRDFTHTGLGVARAADGRVFFTQVFMTR